MRSILYVSKLCRSTACKWYPKDAQHDRPICEYHNVTCLFFLCFKSPSEESSTSTLRELEGALGWERSELISNRLDSRNAWARGRETEGPSKGLITEETAANFTKGINQLRQKGLGYCDLVQPEFFLAI